MKSEIFRHKLIIVLLLVVVGALFLAGCRAGREPSVSKKFTIPDDTQPAELILQDGTTVKVPPGALPAGAMIAISKVDPTKIPALPEGFSKTDVFYDIKTDRALKKPVTLRFPMTKLAEESVLQLSRYRNGQWEPVPFEREGEFILVQTDTLSIWGWLETTADRIDQQVMKYSDPDSYIKWLRKVVGVDKYMEILLEGFSELLSYNDSEAKGLISASARIIEGNKIRLRVRNEIKFYLQISFESPAPVEPRRGAYIDADTVRGFMEITIPGSTLVSDMIKEFLPKDVLLLPGGVAEFVTDYIPGEKLMILGRWTDIAVIYSVLDPGLGLVPIVDLEMVAAARDVLGEGSRFVKALPDLEKGWREHVMNLLNLAEAASKAGALLGEKALKSLTNALLLPFAVQMRKEYLEGRAPSILEKGADARLGGIITIAYLTLTTPANLRARAVSPTRIDLSWDAAKGNVAGYKIYRDGSFLTSVATTSYSDAHLSPSKRYCYRVSAYDRAGNESVRSNEVCATTLAEQPSTLQPNPPTPLEPGATSAPGLTITTLTPVFRWEGVPNADQYALAISVEPYGPAHVIYRNENLTGTSFTLPTGVLKYGKRYRWNMQAGNEAGWSDVSVSLYFRTPSAPEPPIGCTIIVQPGESIQAAIDRAPEGAVICLEAGIWEESLMIGKNIILQGAGRDQTTIKGTEMATIRVERADAEIVIKIAGVAVEGPSYGKGITVAGRSKVSIIASRISDLGTGISVWGLGQLNIEDSSICGNSGCGISVGDSAQVSINGATISRNGKFHYTGSTGSGILVTGSSQVKIKDSTIEGNTSECGIRITAISGDDASRVSIEDSTIRANEWAGIFIHDRFGSTRVDIKNSTITENGDPRIPEFVMQSEVRAFIIAMAHLL